MVERSRIQKKNRAVILRAGLKVFSENGFRGATLDMIARDAGLSKPNLLYYFPSKDAIHIALLEDLLDVWLDPLRQIDPTGDPIEEVLAYVSRKLELSRNFPQESRLFANEIVQGAPRIKSSLSVELKALVDEKADVLENWMNLGAMTRHDPHHLIFSIWAMTQHYADFDVQVQAVLGDRDPYAEAAAFLQNFFAQALKP